MKYLCFILIYWLQAAQPLSAAVIPSRLANPLPWTDTATGVPLPSPAPAAEKKVGFFAKVKATVVSLVVKKAAAKKGADAKRILNIVALSLLLVGLAVPLLGGSAVFLALVPASLVAGIVALFVKDGPEDKSQPAGAVKKRSSNAAAITAIILSGGLLLLFGILSLAMRGGHL